MTNATEIRQYPVEYQKQSNRTMIGIVARYNRVYDLRAFTETLLPGVFAKSITEAARALPLHVNHQHSDVPVGRTLSWEDTPEHLIGTWEFDTRADAVEAARQAEQGYLTGLSVGFNPLQTRWDASGDKPHADRIEARLLETSMCSVPGYDDAGVLAVRSMGNPEMPGLVVVPTPRLLEAKAWLAGIRR